MEYCLIIKRKFFVDPHGSPDYGGTTKTVGLDCKPKNAKWGVE